LVIRCGEAPVASSRVVEQAIGERFGRHSA
jgi:hypothetical protein